MNIRSFMQTSPLLLVLGCSQIVATTATVDTLNSDIPKDYLRIECDLLPIVRTTRHGSHPNIPSKVTVPSKEKRSIIGYSTNWSGYVAETNFTNPAEKSVTAVSGTWVVPTIYSSPQNSYCSLWVGIDGFSSSSVEQIGTEHDWINGAMQHYAWFEMYPGPSYLINGFPLNVGDVITATVNYTSNNIFLMRLYNQYSGQFLKF
ncbi:MAG: G1 family glutamic endopeptidase [Candidatus Babeliales bacterium]